MKNKRLSTLSILFVTLMTLSACGGKKKKDDPTPSPSPTVEPSPSGSDTPTPSPTVEPTPYELSFDEKTNIEVDETNYGEVTLNNYSVGFSRVENVENNLVKLLDRGVILNKTGINGVKNMKINFSSISKAYLYYGDYFMSFTNVVALGKSNNINIPTYCSYFVIQSEGVSVVHDISIGYQNDDEVIFDEELPTFTINTELDKYGNPKEVKSRTTYVNCTLSFTNPDNPKENVEDLEGTIKVRGNSTTLFPKFGYRLKLNSKHSFFGLQKNKSWVLLADYLDGSKMHNYSALSFVKMVRRNTNTFANDFYHVRYFLNGKDMGLFLFSQHINENKGILNIKQDEVWNKSFDEINFYLERDFGPAHDYRETEGLTYFTFKNQEIYKDYPVEQYVFPIMYPSQEDFYEEDSEGAIIDKHETEYKAFFDAFMEYMTDIATKFVKYYEAQQKKKDVKTWFDAVNEVVDLESLALFDATDQMFCESDHSQKSFKMYRLAGQKLSFGPNWDYDSCVDSIFYEGETVMFPYEKAYYKEYNSVWFGERWGYMLYTDKTNGRQYFKNIWAKISEQDIEQYLATQLVEMKHISEMLLNDTTIWMNNAFHGVFDNLRFHYDWISNHARFLKDYLK